MLDRTRDPVSPNSLSSLEHRLKILVAVRLKQNSYKHHPLRGYTTTAGKKRSEERHEHEYNIFCTKPSTTSML